MAVKVKVDKVALQLSFERKVLSTINDNEMLKQIADISVDRIKQFARRGTPLKPNKLAPGKFPQLKDSTVLRRESLSSVNTTHDTFKSSRSNVTFTGQLVDAVISKTDKGKVEISIDSNSREPYKLIRGGKEKLDASNRTNKAVYDSLLSLDEGFAFLGLDAVGIKRIKTLVLRFLRRSLRR